MRSPPNENHEPDFWMISFSIPTSIISPSLRDSFIIEDIELDFAERRSEFVLDDLHSDAVTDDLGPFLDHIAAANVETHRCIKLERITTGRRFGIAIEHADLRTKLIGKNNRRAGFADHEP